MHLAATMPAPSGASSLLIDEASLAALVAKAEAGTKITYHIGHLAHDRCPASQVLDAAACRTLSALANRALRFANAGWVDLVQRRLGPDCWAYILVVRSRTTSRRSPRSIPPALVRSTA
jgi:hypothetical protein